MQTIYSIARNAHTAKHRGTRFDGTNTGAHLHSRGGIPVTLDAMPYRAADGTHGKSTAKVIDDSAR